MGEWYNVNTALPKLTEAQNTELRENINEVLLDSVWDAETNRTCGTNLKIPFLAGKYPTPPKMLMDIYLTDKNVSDFKSCDTFVILLTILVDVQDTIGHANILYIRKEDAKIFWIEPQYSTEGHPYEEFLLPFIDAIQARLGIQSYTRIQPQGTCIQAVARDQNCVFWSLLLYVMVLTKQAETTEEATKIILARFKPGDELRNFIDSAKSTMYDNYIKAKTETSTAGKRRRQWVLSTENQSLPRKTRRLRRRPSKTKSRRSKSARRMRSRELRRSK